MTDTHNSDDSTQRDLSRVNTKVREQRREQAEKRWREHPIEQFLKKKQEDGLVSRDINAKERIIYRFEQYLLEDIAPNTDADICGVRDAIENDVASFRDHDLKPDPNLAERTIVDRLGDLSQFYNVLNRHNAFAGNPVTLPLETFRNDVQLEADRPYIPFHRMQRFMNWLSYPFSRAIWLCGLKHGTRFSEVVNIDLRCLHLDHPVFWNLIENHDVRLDPRIRDKPDTLLIYEEFNEGDEIPNEDTPGPETEGEIRDAARGNKRKEDGGSILPVDSELKTALIEWLLVRPPTYGLIVNPLFVIGGARKKTHRPTAATVYNKLWQRDEYADSIQNFAAEERLKVCPTCGCDVIEENLASGDKTGRRFRCRNCREEHWRSIYWDKGLKTEQKMTYHQARHYFTNAHEPGKTGLHDGAISDKIRKKRIRGDSDKDGDTEDMTYSTASYERYNEDIRKPYLNGIYSFDIYDTLIPAVGEGWDG